MEHPIAELRAVLLDSASVEQFLRVLVADFQRRRDGGDRLA